MTAYKLVRKMRDGYAPLFINKTLRMSSGEWMESLCCPTPGFSPRQGWHCTFEPIAPHLKLTKNRVWVKVQVRDFNVIDRPIHQGGSWILASEMKIIRELSPFELKMLSMEGI